MEMVRVAKVLLLARRVSFVSCSRALLARCCASAGSFQSYQQTSPGKFDKSDNS